MIRQRLSLLSGHWLDRVLAVVSLCLAGAVFLAIRDYPRSAAALPSIIATLLALCAIGLWLFPGKRSDLSGLRLTGLGWALAGVMIALLAFHYLGADVALYLLFTGSALLMGYPLGLRLMVIGALYVLVLGLIFGSLLGVPLSGVLFGLFTD